MQWQYSPNNSGLAKKRRVKKAAAAEATSAAPSPTAHLNPSFLVSPTPLQPLLRPVSISLNPLAGRHLFSASTGSGLVPSSNSNSTAPLKLISDSALLDRLSALPGNESQARPHSAAGQAATAPLAEQAQVAKLAGSYQDLHSSGGLSAAGQEGASSALMQPAEAAAMPRADQTDSSVPKANSADPSQPAGLASVMAAAETQLAPEHVVSQSSLTQAAGAGGRGTEAAAVEAPVGPQPQPVHSPATTNTQTQSTGLVLNISTAGHVADSGGGPSASGLVESSPIEQHGSLLTQPHMVEQPSADGRRIASTTVEALQRPHELDDPVKGQGHSTAALAVQNQIESEPTRFSQERSPEPVGMDSRSGVHVTFPPIALSRSSSISPGSSTSPQARHLSVPNPFRVSPELMCALAPDSSQAPCRLASAPASNSPSAQVLLAPRSTSSEAQLLLAPHVASPQTQLLPAPTFRDGFSAIVLSSDATAGLDALLHAQHQQQIGIKQRLPLMNSEARDDSVSPVCTEDRAERLTQLQTDAAVAGVQSSSPAAAAHLSPHEAYALGHMGVSEEGLLVADTTGQSLDLSVSIEEIF